MRDKDDQYPGCTTTVDGHHEPITNDDGTVACAACGATIRVVRTFDVRGRMVSVLVVNGRVVER